MGKWATRAHVGGDFTWMRKATLFEAKSKGLYTREPSAEELRLIREVLDPAGARTNEVAG